MMRDESYVKRVERYIDEILPIIESDEDRERLKRIRANVERYVLKWKSDMADNQVLIKEAIKRPIRFRNTQSSQGRDLTNSLELDDEDVVKALIMNYEKVDMTSDAGLLLKELDEVLSEMTTLKDEELKVIDYFKKGYSRESIVKELHMKQYKMTRLLSRVCKKVVEFYISNKMMI
jgi:hypothetical protein